MTKLSKIFETKGDVYGFRNSLDIHVEYNPQDDSIDNLSVNSYSYRKGVFIDLTDIFDEVPELVTLIDNIDWREIYREEKIAKQEEVWDEND